MISPYGQAGGIMKLIRTPLRMTLPIRPRNHDLQHGIGNWVFRGRSTLAGAVDQHTQAAPNIGCRRAGIHPTFFCLIHIDVPHVYSDVFHFRRCDEFEELPKPGEFADQSQNQFILAGREIDAFVEGFRGNVGIYLSAPSPRFLLESVFL